jgi:hypothetical protein
MPSPTKTPLSSNFTSRSVVLPLHKLFKYLNFHIQGYNSSIFAYGQTGSGKTYSILGVLPDIQENIYS